jgi:hypothetical protein
VALGAIAASGHTALTAQAPAARRPDLLHGVVWQPSSDSVAPQGTWHRLGATRLLVQWTVVDGLAMLPGVGHPTVQQLPDWRRIASQPWASEVILGLAGNFNGDAAQANAGELARASRLLAQASARAGLTARNTPGALNVVGWYFPVEVDSTWSEAPRLAALLADLPRPLWISAYDNANIGADEYASWLHAWLPQHVGVFFQDGVGLHMREAQVAVRYVEALARRLGRGRVRLIAEAFRPAGPAGRFRAATAAELLPQLDAYRGLVVYVFEGPRYVPDSVVEQLLAAS